MSGIEADSQFSVADRSVDRMRVVMKDKNEKNGRRGRDLVLQFPMPWPEDGFYEVIRNDMGKLALVK